MHKKSLAILLAVVMLFSLVCTPLSQAALHTVTKGDVLWKIAKNYGLTWQELAQHNNLKNANRLVVGQILQIPDGHGNPSVSPAPSPTPTPVIPATGYIDGVYIGSSAGFVGPVTVELTIHNGTISSVKVLSHKESLPQDAPARIPAAIVSKNGVDVDVVAGSTVTSKAIISATRNALSIAQAKTPAVGPSPVDLFIPGTYTATVNGHNSTITVSVKVTDQAIVNATAIKHSETPIVSDLAFERVLGEIVAYQSLAVDSIAGCTITSVALKNAVRTAIEPICQDISKLDVMPNYPAPSTVPIKGTYDVVIVGGGGAGLTAAVQAAEAGAKVALIEKMPTLGGNTIISGGGINAANPEEQIPLNIEDSPQKHYDQTLEAGDFKGDPALVRLMTFSALDGIQWLKNRGYVFDKGVITVAGGLWPRGNRPIRLWPNGSQIVQVLRDQAEKRDVVIYTETKGDELILENGRVVGVRGHRNGAPVELRATKGVIMATGGFAENVELRQEVNTQWPSLDANLKTTNAKGITGDGIVMGQAVGAALTQMNYIQMLPYGDPKSGALPGLIIKDPKDCIYVNKEGKRFVSEYERRDVMTKALIEQPDNFMYIILDKTSYPSEEIYTPFGISIAESVKKGEAFKADTIEELAVMIGMDPKVLKTTIDTYNAGVAAGKDEFGKTLMAPISNPPYYANPRVPTIHHTMGGLKINAACEVLNESGNAIPGFFAAGEVVGGIHGTNRVGGNALAEIIVFGRIAGENAAK